MNLRGLHMLQLVVQTGSFTAAARAANVSQSAVTQAMQSLERRVGAPLFSKDGRHRRPTGVALRVASSVDDFEDAMRLLHKPRTAATAGLRIGISPAAALIFGPTIVNAWHRSAQRGRVVMNNANALDLLRALRRGELDLVVAPRPRSASFADLRVRVLYTSRPAIYARVDHPLRRAGTLSEIRDVGWVVVGTSDGPGGMIEEAFRVRRLGDPQIVAQCDDYSACLELICGSDLMAVIPNDRLVDEFQRTRTRELQIKEGMPRYDVCLFKRVAQDSQPLNGVAQTIVEAILAHSRALRI